MNAFRSRLFVQTFFRENGSGSSQQNTLHPLRSRGSAFLESPDIVLPSIRPSFPRGMSSISVVFTVPVSNVTDRQNRREA